jgi:hypothetical protein
VVNRAKAYRTVPATRNRAPAPTSGGIVPLTSRMASYVVPHTKYKAPRTVQTTAVVG